MMKKILKWVRNIILFLLGTSLFAVVALKWFPVYFTPLMFERLFEQMKDGKPLKLKHDWVSIDEISKNMPQAVVASEDNLFLRHNGFDFKQINVAVKDAQKGRRVRGASTISQQTAKNVFLWQGKSFIRKGLEAYFTVLIEFVWGKKRIMEVYLNSIEMGDGIYGVEAVSKENFNKKALDLTKNEAARIAATLPNPLKFSSRFPSSYIKKRQKKIVWLMSRVDKVDFINK